MASVCVLYVLHDDHWFLESSIRSFRSVGPVVAVISRLSWTGDGGNWHECDRLAREAGGEVVLGDWPDETVHRRASLEIARSRGFTHAFIPDGDEVVEPGLLDTLKRIAEHDIADVAHVHMDTYWKSPRYVIRPREALAPAILLNLENCTHVRIRDYRGPRPLILGPEHGVLHHLSYAGPDERIHRKLSTWGHRNEVVESWYRRVWLGWDRDHAMRDLHPTHPTCYGFAERIEVPEILKNAWVGRTVAEDPPTPSSWPKISIVIPLHGGEEDIRTCLVSLGKVRDLIHECIVVDDDSPDDAPSIAAEFEFVRLLRNDRNRGFAATCNHGYRNSTGDVVLFLNSDTAVPRAGLIRLIECLMGSATIAAAGPMTNNAGYHHPTPVTYTTLDRLDLFAQDFAERDADDDDVSMLVGFCLAVKRSALEEVAEAPGCAFDERFGRGMFEDNDLCYRLERAGYRLRIARRAYVHHRGHATLSKLAEPMEALLRRNERIYEDKWQPDLASGFASHLPGRDWRRVVFDRERHPSRLQREVDRLRSAADISLCMIVRNEERVLADCLRSVQGYFAQVVVVDTGSTDRTREIVLEHGAELHDYPWTESFADARNQSLSYARGRWILWLDADDTLPAATAHLMLQAAIHAPSEVVGFVVPVRFTDGGPAGGTQVDHVKLFRNVPGVSFEGRIHEQVLQSLRPHGEIARLEGAVVLHSGYDVSPEGQARKRARDARLLELDLAERPNHPFVLFNLGMTDHYNGNHAAAVDWLRRSIAAASPGESQVRKAYALLGVSLREMDRPQEALSAFDEGLAAVGNDAELQFQAALVLTALGRLTEARDRYLAMPQEAGKHFSSLDVAILGPKRSHNLGTVEALLGNYPEAKTCFNQGIEQGFSPSALALFELALEREDFRVARESLTAFGQLEGWPVDWATGRARLAKALGEDPVQELLALSRHNPKDPNPRLALVRWLLREPTGPQPPNLVNDLLRQLDDEGIAEACFYRGVAAVREGDFGGALLHHRRARRLDPANPQNETQVQALLNALAIERTGKEEVLFGPHRGRLGVGEIPVSVIVVTFNSEEFLKPCIASIQGQLGPEDEVIVVDNASNDLTVRQAEDLAFTDPRIRVIANTENIGYAAAANQGILVSRGRAILLCNPDTVFGSAVSNIQALADLLQPGVGAVGPLSDSVGGDQFVGHWLPADHRPARERLPASVARLHGQDWRETKLLMGFCLMTSRAVLDTYGLLDEACELGADDLELSWRLRSFGLELRIGLGTFVHHVGGASFSTIDASAKHERVARSDAALLDKLRRTYGLGPLPSSRHLWGCDVFKEAMARIPVLVSSSVIQAEEPT